ncbi:MAG: SOS response-associated peptidase [Actinomycetales bacterium]|nr:SOS response-associated peptidase [Actinomycetales bacterium]
MCGRYAAAKDQAELVLEFEVEVVATGEPSRSVLANPQQPPAGTPDHNMAPTKQAPVVLTRAPRRAGTGGQSADAADPAAAAAAESVGEATTALRQLRLMTWGLVPSWAKDPSVGVRMINARAESVLDKPAFRRAVASRRLLVPAAGWYEWQPSPTVLDAKGKPRKQPFFIARADGHSCAFAGVYEFWRDPAIIDGSDPAAWLSSFTILTTAAEPGLDRIHDRQPLVLEPADWSTWLDPLVSDPAEVRHLLAFREEGRFTAYPVTTAVNRTANTGPELLLPAPTDQLRGVVDPATGEVIG